MSLGQRAWAVQRNCAKNQGRDVNYWRGAVRGLGGCSLPSSPPSFSSDGEASAGMA
jgi:hypothetical protein